MTPNPNDLQNTFRALADPSRRKILKLLGDQDMTIAEVARHFDMTRAAVKKHIGVLQQGDLVKTQRSGREVINRLEPAAMRDIFDWVRYFERYWDDRLVALKNVSEKNTTQPPKNDPKNDPIFRK